jgi:tetratricopeptide (TPR) repeat protein
MNEHLIRAQLLYRQSRYDLAAQEVRRVLSETPHDAVAHALLGLCLVAEQKFDEAQSETEQAIVLAPDFAYAHYCQARVLEQRKRFPEAETAAREAIRLEPLNAEYHARLAATLFQQDKWQATLDSALEGLKYDPENEACGHLQTMALTKLGRQREAVASVDQLLSRAPDDAMAHTNKGWALLHQGKPREALEHFREALRIDPSYRYAQSGIVEALKARNPLYRWILAYFLWMSRLSSQARWAVLIGGYVGIQALQKFGDADPTWAPWIQPVVIIYIVFVLLTWFAVPFFNLLLRFHKFGWYALSHDQRRSSNWFGGCLAVFIAAVVAYFIWNMDLALLVAGYALGMSLPLVTLFYCDIGWPRQAMTWFTLAMAAVGALTIACASLDMEVTHVLIQAFVFGFIGTPWLANYLVQATPRR